MGRYQLVVGGHVIHSADRLDLLGAFLGGKKVDEPDLVYTVRDSRTGKEMTPAEVEPILRRLEAEAEVRRQGQFKKDEEMRAERNRQAEQLVANFVIERYLANMGGALTPKPGDKRGRQRRHHG